MPRNKAKNPAHSSKSAPPLCGTMQVNRCSGGLTTQLTGPAGDSQHPLRQAALTGFQM
jgi:hypothetical protein